MSINIENCVTVQMTEQIQNSKAEEEKGITDYKKVSRNCREKVPCVCSRDQLHLKRECVGTKMNPVAVGKDGAVLETV